MKRKQLEEFRDLKISLSDLTEEGRIDLWKAKIVDGSPVEVCAKHIRNLLNNAKSKLINDQDLVKWAYTVRWTDLFTLCDEYHDSIIGILDKIVIEMNKGHRTERSGVREVDIMRVVNGTEEVVIRTSLDEREINLCLDALTKNIEL